MKTQIIQLNQNEDYISVQEKMSWCQANRILLVWPDKGHVLNRPLELNLIRRHATRLGVQLWLVTRDSEVCFYARMFGINVVGSPPNSEADLRWDKQSQLDLPERKRIHPDHTELHKEIHPIGVQPTAQPIITVVCLTLCSLALFILTVWILPGAKIILIPQVEAQSMVFNLVANPAAISINYATGTVPTYFQEIIINGQDTTLTTGKVKIPDKRALGNLRFTNSSEQSITIPAGTKVATSGNNPIMFITTSSKDEALPADRSVYMQAQAMNPGLQGNLPPETLVMLLRNLGSGLTVTNPLATSGGTDVEVPSPSTQDLERLHKQLVNHVIADAQTKFQSLISTGDILITPSITSVEILDETQYPAIGDPGSQLELSLRIRLQSQVVSRNILRGFINPAMDAYTPAGYLSLPDSLIIKESKITGLNSEGNYIIYVRATRKVQISFPSQRIINLVRGKTITEAINNLSANMPLANPANINIYPGWWPWLPLLASRIELEQAEVR